MTRDAARLAETGHGHSDLDAALVAALWEEVPFPRLPFDAPSELKDLVIEIENPKRVYAVHRASRRHNFQLLVEKFIVQLRYGCGYEHCPTPSCFKCRKRLAGKDPIRRYSPTSARTLAIYLASQDNPESRLCPYLQSPKGSSDAIKPLIFSPKSIPAANEQKGARSFKQANGHAHGNSLSPKDNVRVKPRSSASKSTVNASPRETGSPRGRDTSGEVKVEDGPLRSHPAAQISIKEKDIRTDYRSFAANVFGTVAFRMLEWLTPNNLAAISDKASEALEKGQPVSGTLCSNNENGDEEGLFVPSESSSVDLSGTICTPGASECPQESFVDTRAGRQVNGEVEKNYAKEAAATSHGFNSPSRPGHSRRNSKTRLRTSSIPPPQPKVPTDHADDNVHGLMSPRATFLDQAIKSSLRSSPAIARKSSHDNELETIADVHVSEKRFVRRLRGNDQETQINGANSVNASSVGDTSPSIDTQIESGDAGLGSESAESMSELDSLLPQSLSQLNIQAVDFLCDVLQEDGTAEIHFLEPPSVRGPMRRSSRTIKSLRRKRKFQSHYPRSLRLEWKLFAEQSIFHVLSDPHAILDSFTTPEGLIDSPTLWHCMFRMTRIAPSLVYDSLWNASASLFAPPKALKSSRSPTAKVFPKQEKSLTNEEAGRVLSVCFHALVAAAPLVNDSRQLVDMSRIRSRGLILAESGAVARQPSSLCLQYDDAFSDSMAMRLARRLLAAIPTRKYFDGLVENDLDSQDGIVEPDTLETLLSHLDMSYSADDREPLLDFSWMEREVHNKRIPILLLDWARAVMLDEWSGRPEVPGDGPFGGALSLMEAMHRKRVSLALSDTTFRTEYFGDRLDTIEMPVSWLSFNSTKQKAHLLDHPYMFNQSSLVSYFRAINFSRMSRAYEEATSLQSRINAIIAHDSLVTDQHQKSVLQELLKTPSSKFLILDIGRKTVLTNAFDQLWRRQERELMRPLKVHLGEDTGEEGFDSGGVQQEFFRLAIAEAMNPDYGAFTIDERTRMAWFRPGSLQPEWKLELIGLVISLAVYNGLTLPITFPKALYRKLLGEPVTDLHHIADGWPDLANGLTNLLEWDEKDGSVEDIFARTYEFSIDMFGQPVSRQMDSSQRASWPQFSNHPFFAPLSSHNPVDAPMVTGDNRNTYVSDYIRYLTDISIAPQFEAFARGFRTCLRPKSFSLLTPSLLQSIVEGTQEIDIAELRRAARYVGWDASHHTVRDFWSIVKRYDDRMKRKLLEFVTASDRLPVGGMRNVQFVVQKNGEEEGVGGHLPTAYTCYGTLLLPEYRDKEVLREKMAMALANAQGFGFA